MTTFYAGIGSRRTPEDVLVLMDGWPVWATSSGPGADAGAGSLAEIFLPWPQFNLRDPATRARLETFILD